PFFGDADLELLPAPNGVDDTTTLRTALNAAGRSNSGITKVHLRQGTYRISGSINIPDGVTLMGVPGFRSIIRPTQSFADSYDVPNPNQPTYPRGYMLTTPNSPTAHPVIMDLSVF